MPDNNSRRIAGIHVQPDGIIGAVWLAHDKETDVIELYNACVFKQQSFADIAEGLIANGGRWTPIAWHKDAKEVADKLLERGCQILHEPVDDSEAVAEVNTREILTRRDTGRFFIVDRLKNWLDEAGFLRAEGKVPISGYPLMSATRHAYAQLEYAKRQTKRNPAAPENFRRIAMI